jgi:hypothetical protein
MKYIRKKKLSKLVINFDILQKLKTMFFFYPGIFVSIKKHSLSLRSCVACRTATLAIQQELDLGKHCIGYRFLQQRCSAFRGNFFKNYNSTNSLLLLTKRVSAWGTAAMPFVFASIGAYGIGLRTLKLLESLATTALRTLRTQPVLTKGKAGLVLLPSFLLKRLRLKFVGKPMFVYYFQKISTRFCQLYSCFFFGINKTENYNFFENLKNSDDIKTKIPFFENKVELLNNSIFLRLFSKNLKTGPKYIYQTYIKFKNEKKKKIKKIQLLHSSNNFEIKNSKDFNSVKIIQKNMGSIFQSNFDLRNTLMFQIDLKMTLNSIQKLSFFTPKNKINSYRNPLDFVFVSVKSCTARLGKRGLAAFVPLTILSSCGSAYAAYAADAADAACANKVRSYASKASIRACKASIGIAANASLAGCSTSLAERHAMRKANYINFYLYNLFTKPKLQKIKKNLSISLIHNKSLTKHFFIINLQPRENHSILYIKKTKNSNNNNKNKLFQLSNRVFPDILKKKKNSFFFKSLFFENNHQSILFKKQYVTKYCPRIQSFFFIYLEIILKHFFSNQIVKKTVLNSFPTRKNKQFRNQKSLLLKLHRCKNILHLFCDAVAYADVHKTKKKTFLLNSFENLTNLKKNEKKSFFFIEKIEKKANDWIIKKIIKSIQPLNSFKNYYFEDKRTTDSLIIKMYRQKKNIFLSKLKNLSNLYCNVSRFVFASIGACHASLAVPLFLPRSDKNKGNTVLMLTSFRSAYQRSALLALSAVAAKLLRAEARKTIAVMLLTETFLKKKYNKTKPKFYSFFNLKSFRFEKCFYSFRFLTFFDFFFQNTIYAFLIKSKFYQQSFSFSKRLEKKREVVKTFFSLFFDQKTFVILKFLKIQNKKFYKKIQKNKNFKLWILYLKSKKKLKKNIYKICIISLYKKNDIFPMEFNLSQYSKKTFFFGKKKLINLETNLLLYDNQGLPLFLLRNIEKIKTRFANHLTALRALRTQPSGANGCVRCVRSVRSARKAGSSNLSTKTLLNYSNQKVARFVLFASFFNNRQNSATRTSPMLCFSVEHFFYFIIDNLNKILFLDKKIKSFFISTTFLQNKIDYIVSPCLIKKTNAQFFFVQKLKNFYQFFKTKSLLHLQKSVSLRLPNGKNSFNFTKTFWFQNIYKSKKVAAYAVQSLSKCCFFIPLKFFLNFNFFKNVINHSFFYIQNKIPGIYFLGFHIYHHNLRRSLFSCNAYANYVRSYASFVFARSADKASKNKSETRPALPLEETRLKPLIFKKFFEIKQVSNNSYALHYSCGKPVFLARNKSILGSLGTAVNKNLKKNILESISFQFLKKLKKNFLLGLNLTYKKKRLTKFFKFPKVFNFRFFFYSLRLLVCTSFTYVSTAATAATAERVKRRHSLQKQRRLRLCNHFFQQGYERSRLTYVQNQKGLGNFIKSSLKIQTLVTILKLNPAASYIRKHLQEIRNTIHKCKSSNQIFLIEKLSPIIRSWSYYYKNINNKDFLHYCDFITFKMLWRWACRRHPKKNKNWIKKKYFKSLNGKNWVFSYQKKIIKTQNKNSNFLRFASLARRSDDFVLKKKHNKLFFKPKLKRSIQLPTTFTKSIQFFICLPIHSDLKLTKQLIKLDI